MSVTSSSSFPDNDEFTRLVHHYGGSLSLLTHGRKGLEYRCLCTNVSCEPREKTQCFLSLMKAAVQRLFPEYVACDDALFDKRSCGFTCLIAETLNPDSAIVVVFDIVVDNGSRSLLFLDAFSLQETNLTRQGLINYESELKKQSRIVRFKRSNYFRVWNRSAFAAHIVTAVKFRHDFVRFGFMRNISMELCVHDEWMFETIVSFIVNKPRTDIQLDKLIAPPNNGMVFKYEDKINGDGFWSYVTICQTPTRTQHTYLHPSHFMMEYLCSTHPFSDYLWSVVLNIWPKRSSPAFRPLCLIYATAIT